MALTVLHVEGSLGKKLDKALRGASSPAAAMALLGKQVDPGRPPTWLVFNDGKTLDVVAHLEAPMFRARGADEDEFFHEPGGEQLVVDSKGRGTRVTAGGESTPAKLSPADVKRITAYDAGGFLLRDLEWLGKPPKTLGEVTKLLAKATDAYSGDLPPYENALASDAPSKVAPAAAPGSGGMFLDGPERRGVYVTRVARKQPKLVWTSSYEDNGGCEYGGNPVIADGLVFAGDSGFNAKCSATDLKGKSVWKIELTKSQSSIIGSAVVDRGVVYQATNKNLFALDAKTGKRRWTANLSAVSGSPLVVGDLVFIGTGEGLLGLSIANGRRQWAFPVKRDKYKEGVLGGVAFRDGALFFIAQEKLFAVDIETKKARWTAPAYARAVPSVDDTAVYTWSPAGLVALDRQTGKERWHFKFASLNWDKTIAVADDRVVVRADGRLVALDKARGKKLWELAIRSAYDIGCASPVIAGDVVLCVLVEEDSNKVILHAVDLKSGKVLWKRDEFPLRKKEKAPLSWYCTPAIVADGTILVQAYGLQALR